MRWIVAVALAVGVSVPLAVVPTHVRVLSARATPWQLSVAGGIVTVTGRTKNATTCHLTLSSPYVEVTWSHAARSCTSGRFSALVTFGPNTSTKRRNVQLELVARHASSVATGKFYVSLAPRVLLVTTTSTPVAPTRTTTVAGTTTTTPVAAVPPFGGGGGSPAPTTTTTSAVPPTTTTTTTGIAPAFNVTSVWIEGQNGGVADAPETVEMIELTGTFYDVSGLTITDNAGDSCPAGGPAPYSGGGAGCANGGIVLSAGASPPGSQLTSLTVSATGVPSETFTWRQFAPVVTAVADPTDSSETIFTVSGPFATIGDGWVSIGLNGENGACGPTTPNPDGASPPSPRRASPPRAT